MSQNNIEKKLKRELEDMQNLWLNGSNPSLWGWEKALENFNKSPYPIDIDYIERRCILPCMTPASTVLDIGTNGGFWLGRMKNAKRLIGIDALPAAHLGFWSRMTRDLSPEELKKVEFHQISDFKCSFLEDNSIDYVFSYDVFCHISYSGAKAYIENLAPKLKKGANCFIMIADYDKYIYKDRALFIGDAEDSNKFINLNGLNKLAKGAGFDSVDEFVADYDGIKKQSPGRWYFYNTDRFVELIENNDYELINRDVAVIADPLNPIIHFRKL